MRGARSTQRQHARIRREGFSPTSATRRRPENCREFVFRSGSRATRKLSHSPGSPRLVPPEESGSRPPYPKRGSLRGTRQSELSTDADLRRHLIEVLEGGNAHIRLAEVVSDFPVERAGIRPEGSPHSAWELLEHLRIAQADIVLFSLGMNYVELKWPYDYWPSSPVPKNDREWEASVESVAKI